METTDEVEAELLHLLQSLTDAMEIMENLDEENKPALVGAMESVVQSFKNLHALEPKISGSVPLELIEQIDQGNNPDDYSRKLVEESQMSAKRVEEKQRWMREFKGALDRSIATTFGDCPDLKY